MDGSKRDGGVDCKDGVKPWIGRDNQYYCYYVLLITVLPGTVYSSYVVLRYYLAVDGEWSFVVIRTY